MKTGKGLLDYALKQIGRPYWWGCFGQRATEELLAAKRRQYPEHYLARDFESQLGQRVHDCVGLIKGYRWSENPDSEPVYRGAEDVSVQGLYAQCGRRGDIASLPEKPGVCLFNSGLGHVGVYAGGGQVVEALGHSYGVLLRPLNSGRWRCWGMPDWLSYGMEGSGELRPAYYFYNLRLPLLKRGIEDRHICALQRLLGASGRSLEADGIFGPETEKAVKEFQRTEGLEPDGEVGGLTWRALLEA